MLHIPFTSDRLQLNLSPTSDLTPIIRLLCELVVKAPGVPSELDIDELLADVQDRDARGGTVRVSRDMVCLHLRRPDVEAVRVSICTLVRPVAWTDGENAQIICLLASPRERPVQSLRVFAQLERLMADPAAVAWILNGTDANDLAPWLDARLHEDDSTLTARDLMRPSMARIGPDTPVPTLAHAMARYNLDAIGITDENRKLLGMVTADDLFAIGLPDFFHQLESVGFLAEFDPFERYFAKEQSLLARDVMQRNPLTLPPDATVLEVVFALTVKKAPKVFVVEADGRLVGVLDRIRVIDRILEL